MATVRHIFLIVARLSVSRIHVRQKRRDGSRPKAEGSCVVAVGRVVIVGAGPAGAALAYLLARRGVEVALLERHPDFERTFRGDGLQPSGIDAFDQMGLGDRLRQLPQAIINTIELYHGGAGSEPGSRSSRWASSPASSLSRRSSPCSPRNPTSTRPSSSTWGRQSGT